MKQSYVNHVIDNLHHPDKWYSLCSPKHPHWFLGDLHIWGNKEINPETGKLERFHLTYEKKLLRNSYKVRLVRYISDETLEDYGLCQDTFISEALIGHTGRQLSLSKDDVHNLSCYIPLIQLMMQEAIHKQDDVESAKQEKLKWWP